MSLFSTNLSPASREAQRVVLASLKKLSSPDGCRRHLERQLHVLHVLSAARAAALRETYASAQRVIAASAERCLAQERTARQAQQQRQQEQKQAQAAKNRVQQQTQTAQSLAQQDSAPSPRRSTQLPCLPHQNGLAASSPRRSTQLPCLPYQHGLAASSPRRSTQLPCLPHQHGLAAATPCQQSCASPSAATGHQAWTQPDLANVFRAACSQKHSVSLKRTSGESVVYNAQSLAASSKKRCVDKHVEHFCASVVDRGNNYSSVANRSTDCSAEARMDSSCSSGDFLCA